MKRRRIDRYEIHELIGEGGMGAVYRAIDSRLGRTVALKTVVSHRSGEGLTDELRQRFMREALAASQVDHRNVVHVIDFGVTDDGTPYLVMEYLRGRDLGVLLKKSKVALAIDYVADVMLGVCAALRACHQLGIVHRDLKPSNIFLADTDTGPEIKVLDFGVSKAPTASDLTQEGQILGTPQYLSPEQVNGKVGPESDQYALGVLLYVCLTKKLPFEEHQNLSLLRAIEAGRFQGPRTHRPEIPEPLEAIVLRAMHANPTERFESVHALGQALWSFASSRAQVEWKNYYFHTPPASAFGEETLRGIPHAPLPGVSGISVAQSRLGAPATVEPTAVLAPSVDLAPNVFATASPQLFLSTKLAKPTPPTGPEALTPAAEPAGEGSWKRWATFGVAAGIISAGLWIGYRHFGTAAATASIAPAATPASSKVSKLPLPTAPPAADRAPDAVDLPRSSHPETGAQAPVARVRPKVQKKMRSVRQLHEPQSDQPPRLTGLDKNGIGIPSN
ncbi:MAG TPA: protein kinase [Polyangia bacterium]|nr:protein kinase [Polyangia bacterium]